MNNFLLPLLVNILSPIALFLLAYFAMKNNWLSTWITEIYTSVKEGLRVRTEIEEIESAGEKFN